LFVGGLVAGRLAATYNDRIGALHGFVTWALASLLGLAATVCVVSMLTGGAMHTATTRFPLSDDITVYPGMRQAELQHAADTAGKLLLGASLSLLAGLGAAVGGGALATRKAGKARHASRTTKEVPIVPPPPEPPPADAPHVTQP
jgi:hypothetical protein